MVHMRVGGVMKDYMKDARFRPPEYNTLVNRVMTMANLDTTRPGGRRTERWNFPTSRIMFDVRVAVIPTYLMSTALDAVKLQMRIFFTGTHSFLSRNSGFGEGPCSHKAALQPSFGDTADHGTHFRRERQRPLHSILRTLDLESEVCYTVEDPVEYHLDNAYQIQVSEHEGRSFSRILRSLMRLDPAHRAFGRDQGTKRPLS